MLEKKEKVLIKKASAEVEKAKEFTRATNKRGTVIDCFFQLVLIFFSFFLFCYNEIGVCVVV